MSFNIIHYIIFVIGFFILLAGIVAAFKQSNKKLFWPIILSNVLIASLAVIIGVTVTEKYTKKVKLLKIDNRRYLGQEKISYFGVVKNVGKFPVKKVYISIKLVNGGHTTGNKKGTDFYKTDNAFSFFSKNTNKIKLQKLEKELVIARDLTPGEIARFRVTFHYPGYFRNTAHFIKIYAH